MGVSLSPRLRGALRIDTLYWLLPFLLFLTTRLFSAFEYLPVGGDQCKYLVLGRTFPLHQVDNQSLFLLHPPAFGWTIGLLALVMPLLSAGLLATLGYACANFFAVRAYGAANGLSPPALMVGLLFLGLDRASVAYDTHVGRVSIMLFSFTLALLAYERWLRSPTTRTTALVVTANVLCAFVSDQALNLLLCQIVVFVVHFDRRRIRRALVLLGVTSLTFLVWPAVRLWIYSHHAHYPAGLDGTIEFTQPITWLSLIQPHYLPFTRAHAGLYMNVAPSLADYDVTVLLRRPLDLLLVHPFLSGALAIALVVAAFLRPERRAHATKYAALSVALLLPASVGLNEWHGMGFVIPFALLLGEGAMQLWNGLPSASRWLQPLLSVICLPLMAGWILNDRPAPFSIFQPSGGTNFLFRRQPVTRGQEFSKQLFDLPPEEGVMAPVGFTPELVYLTGKRVVALPFEPDLIERFVREYRVTRIVLTNETLGPQPNATAEKFASALSTRFLLEHPARFLPIVSVEESYPGIYPPNNFLLLMANPAPP